MNSQGPSIQLHVDAFNPGQFFACCGLLELAGRCWPDALGWFDDLNFFMTATGTLQGLLEEIGQVELVQLDEDDIRDSRILVGNPFDLRLDWWHDTLAGGRNLKVWGGKMASMRIARAMQVAIRGKICHTEDVLNFGTVACETADSTKKVEPFYFDARRGENAHSRDVGFAPCDIKLRITAFPAVELLCLIGLQRVRPLRIGRTRFFTYHTWQQPLPIELAPTAVAGHLSGAGLQRFQFQNLYRDGQKRHKAFLSATLRQPAGGQ